MALLKLSEIRIVACVPNDDGSVELTLDLDRPQVALVAAWGKYHLANPDSDDLPDHEPEFVSGDAGLSLEAAAVCGDTILQFHETQPRAMDDCHAIYDLRPHRPKVEERLKAGGYL